ncbi:MAG: MASE1 domain-containing protein [Usitatibacter sp.]
MEIAHRLSLGSGSSNSRALRVAAFVCVAYYLGTKLGLSMTFRPLPISILWPPNAILLAALLLLPPRSWWIAIAAALPAHVAAEIQGGVPFTMAMGWFASNCSEAIIGASAVLLLTRGEPLRFDSFRHAGAFMVGGAFLAPFVSSFLDAGLVRLIAWGEGAYWELWRARFFSNVLSELTIVPVIVGWAATDFAALRAAPASLQVETGVFTLGLIVVMALVFETDVGLPAAAPALLCAPVPFLIWAAVRLGPRGTSTSLLAIVFMVGWGVIHGQGPFVKTSPAESAIAVQLFFTVLAIPLLLLAAVLGERERTLANQQRMEREAEEQKNRMTHLARVALLGELTGALAHELNQPLTAILANAQATERLLSADTVNVVEMREIVGDIVADDLRAAEVIRRLWKLLKRGETQMQPIDANALAREVLHLVQGDLLGRKIVATARLAEDLPQVRGDRVQLEQVLLNLVTNACDEMAATLPADRHLVLATQTCGLDRIRISISDHGPGVDPALLEALFEPFFTTKPQGLGLGLSVSRSIVTAHHGRIWAENQPGGGATFIVELPASREAS